MSLDDTWARYAAMDGVTEGVPCPTCRGTGLLPDSPDWCGIEPGGTVRCPTCRGTGVVAAPPAHVGESSSGSTPA